MDRGRGAGGDRSFGYSKDCEDRKKNISNSIQALNNLTAKVLENKNDILNTE